MMNGMDRELRSYMFQGTCTNGHTVVQQMMLRQPPGFDADGDRSALRRECSECGERFDLTWEEPGART
jgi:transcriptional regulator NrdR family protein